MGQCHHLYYLLYPPPPVAANAAQLWRRRSLRLEADSSPMPADRLHITLHPLGRFIDFVPHDVLDRALAVGGVMDDEPFDVTFDLLQSRDVAKIPNTVELAGHRPALRKLHRFQRRLGDTMLSMGFAPAAVRADFSPHITLDYKHAPVARQAIASVTWRVTQLFLVDSLYGQGRHEVLAHWALSARQQEFSDW